jgi:hypothetical protein
MTPTDPRLCGMALRNVPPRISSDSLPRVSAPLTARRTARLNAEGALPTWGGATSESLCSRVIAKCLKERQGVHTSSSKVYAVRGHVLESRGPVAPHWPSALHPFVQGQGGPDRLPTEPVDRVHRRSEIGGNDAAVPDQARTSCAPALARPSLRSQPRMLDPTSALALPASPHPMPPVRVAPGPFPRPFGTAG